MCFQIYQSIKNKVLEILNGWIGHFGYTRDNVCFVLVSVTQSGDVKSNFEMLYTQNM